MLIKAKRKVFDNSPHLESVKMILHGIDFSVFDASGVEGFFGEGYLHHKLLGPFAPNFSGCTFVAKTTTLNERQGNMPLFKYSIVPKEWIPKSVKVYFKKGIMLNAVGLSGPGAEFLFEYESWQERTEPFFISFMSVKDTAEKRTAELQEFVNLFAQHLPSFKAKVGLQINYSCPNIGIDPDSLIFEALTGLNIASNLGIMLMPKFNVLASPRAVKTISNHFACDAICVSNTIPWGKLPEKINWKKIFGSEISPLVQFGGGGLSGKPLLPLVIEWLIQARSEGIRKPICAGGGILSPDDLEFLYHAGASSVFIGSVATLRPWRVQKIIRRAHQLFGKGESQ